MGVDLKLLPLDTSNSENDSRFYCSTILDLTRSSAFWQEVRKLQTQEITAPLRTPLGVFDEDNSLWDLRETICDANEDLLHWVTADDLISLQTYVPNSHQNRAAWAYLAELPPETKIVLYWC